MISSNQTISEVDEKQARLVTTIKDAGLGGVLLATHHNIAWLTGGRSNRVDGSREAGTQRLLVTADGRTHQVDCIILGTGFTATDQLAPMRIIGDRPHASSTNR